MSEPAILAMESREAEPGRTELVVQIRTAWAEHWLPLRDAVRAHPPADNSLEETEVLRQFAMRMLAVVGGVGGLAVLVEKTQGGVEAMWRREYAETRLERKLGMRLVGEALGTLADLLQELQIHRAPSRETLDAALAQAQADLARVEAWPPGMRDLFKLELTAFVAFDLAGLEDTGEFCEWARRAVVAARRARTRWYPSPVVTSQPLAPWSDDAIVTHVVLAGPDVTRIAQILDEPPAPTDALRAFLRDG